MTYRFGSEARRVGAYDVEAASIEAAVSFEGQVSRTQQHQKDETDINGIVKRFRVTGLLPQGIRRPTYGDFDSVTDFRSAMDAVIAAEKSFASLPSEVRKKFDNDPAKFVDFCSDERNLDAMREMGLAVPKAPEPEPMAVRVIPDPVVPPKT